MTRISTWRCPNITGWQSRRACALRTSQDESLLLLEEGHCLRDQALEVCGRISVQERQDFRATSLETLRQMVAAGAGVTLMPELASRGAYGNARGVVIRPLVRPTPHRQIGAVWRKSSARLAAIQALLRHRDQTCEVSCAALA